MKFEFYKYQGTGNDFVILDDRKEIFPKDNFELVAKLCDRKFGIGADGLMLLRNHQAHDFEMVYFNSDGHEGSMCGNGGRALVKFAFDLGIIKEACTFFATDGVHKAQVEEGLVHLHMMDVSLVEEAEKFTFLDTGSPHYVEFITQELETFDVYHEGKKVRNNDRFKEEGTNVNFVEVIGADTLFVRTYERGVEDETLSCGTGVTACALSANLRKMQSPIKIKTLGGDLKVSFKFVENAYKDIYLIGPAERVFKGEIDTFLF